MNPLRELLEQLKRDTRDRGTMAVLLFGALALAAAVAWVAMGSASTTEPHVASAAQPALPATGATRPVADSAKSKRHENAVKARARAKHTGPARDPFEKLVVETKTESGSSKATSSSASKSVPAPKEQATPSGTKHVEVVQPKKIYSSVVNLEVAAATTTHETVALELLDHRVIRATKPSNAPALLEIVKVNVPGQSVTFKLGKDVKMLGGGYCEPSLNRCDSIRVKKNVAVHLESRRGGEPTLNFAVRAEEFKAIEGSISSSRIVHGTRRNGMLRASK